MNLHYCDIHGTFDYTEYGSYCPQCYPADHKDMSGWGWPSVRNDTKKQAAIPLATIEKELQDDSGAAVFNQIEQNDLKGE